MDSSLVQLAAEYSRRGPTVDAGLLLSSADAMQLLNEPALKDVMILGCTGWRWTDRAAHIASPDPAALFAVETQVPYIDLWPRLSADLVKQYLREQLPAACDLVLIRYDDPQVAALFGGAR